MKLENFNGGASLPGDGSDIITPDFSILPVDGGTVGNPTFATDDAVKFKPHEDMSAISFYFDEDGNGSGVQNSIPGGGNHGSLAKTFLIKEYVSNDKLASLSRKWRTWRWWDSVVVYSTLSIRLLRR